MSGQKMTTRAQAIVLMAAFVFSVSVAPLPAQTAAVVQSASLRKASSPYRPNKFSKRARLHYGLVWGVDSLQVKTVESGEMIRLTYRVVDANKAKMLNDSKVEPVLIDPQARVKLVIPTMEKIGKLRQSSTPEAGRSYWMAFSNKGRLVRPGHRVSVVIGQFRADGLVVQ
jgi:hypothetical protein